MYSFVYYRVMIKGENMVLNNNNNEVIVQGIDFVDLDSVGCRVDLHTGMTHPIEQEGCVNKTPDVAIHLNDVSTEWLDSLSRIEYALVEDLIEQMEII